MADYELSSRCLSLEEDWDVIVVGGGPSGCTAAAAAAREGARTLLVEATGMLGGMGTAGLMPAWCPFSDNEKIIYRGLAERVFNATKARMSHVAAESLNWVPIDPEALKIVYDDLVAEAGVTVRFITSLVAVECDPGGEAATLIIGSKAGLTALRGRVYIDCTGDGDLAAWAGAEFEQGGPEGTLQPATHCFSLGNVDEVAYRTGPAIHAGNPDSPIYDILSSGKYPLIPDIHACNSLIAPRTVGFNAGHIWDVDNTDPESVSRALPVGRQMARAFRDALAEFYPTAFAGSFVASTGALMGVRETRRIMGDYVLTVEDYKARRSFDDEICRNAYYLDVHHTAAEAKGFRPGDSKWEKRSLRYEPGESHGIPYRCLTPRGLRNVLVAGRCISSDRATNGSVRVMPVCLATGEAAGLAAAVAADKCGGDVHAVDTDYLRQRLSDEGVWLPDVE
jgi:FAD-dependent oxidoreductase family protein